MSAKTGVAPVNATAVRRCGERERWDDHLVPGADTHGHEAEVQRGRPGVHCDALPSAHESCEFALESGYLRPLCEPTGG